MKQTLTIIAAATLTQWCNAQSDWTMDVDRLVEVKDFLEAQAEAWESRWPSALEFSVDYETTATSMHWEGIVNGSRVDCEYVVHRFGGPGDSQKYGGEGQRRMLRCSGKEWMQVIPHQSGDTAKPWTAQISTECPTPYWRQTMLNNVRQPITGVDLAQIYAEFPILQVREDDEGIDVDFAVNEPVLDAILEKRFDDIGGFVIVRARFERASGWRPVDFIEIYRYPKGVELGVLETLDTVDVAGMEGRIYRHRTWRDFTRVGELQIPTTYTMDSWVSPNVHGELEAWPYSERHSLEVRALSSEPTDSQFVLEPSSTFGPVGKINNSASGQVTIVDARGVSDRMNSQDTFVRRAIQESNLRPARAGGGLRRLSAYGCLVLGGVCMALIVLRSRSRRSVA